MKRRPLLISICMMIALFSYSQTTGESSFLIQAKGWYYINITLNSANFSNNFQWQPNKTWSSSAILFSQIDYTNENTKSICLVDENDLKKYSTLANVNYNVILDIPNPYNPNRKNSLLGGIGSFFLEGLRGTY